MVTGVPSAALNKRAAISGVAVVVLACSILAPGTYGTDNYALTGAWELSPNESDVLPVHAMVIPGDQSDQVLAVAGSGNDPTFSRGVNQARLWNPFTQQYTAAFEGANIPAGTPPTLHDNDAFCSAHVALPDGHLLIAGGNLEYPNYHGGGTHPVHTTPPNYDSPDPRPACHDFLGLRDSFIYHPDNQNFTRGPKMQHGRWYPSLLSLGDGRVLTISGLDDIGQGGVIPDANLPAAFQGQDCRYPVLNRSIEIFNPTTMAWGAAFTPSGPAQLNPDNLGLYPYLHLLPSGDVFLAGPSNQTQVFDPETAALLSTKFSTRGGWRDYGHSTLLALRPSEGYRARVLNAGGAGDGVVESRAEMIDFSAADPQWTPVAPMSRARYQGASVLLPDGKVFVAGGGSGGDTINNSHLAAEIYDPATNTWSYAGSAQIPRMYHSVALVLPDGRVYVAGSNPHDSMDLNERAVETRVEIYSPPYLFKGSRPEIPNHPDRIRYATAFNIQLGSVNQVTNARQVVLLRPGSTTHTRNFDQRLVELTFTTNPDFPRRLIVTGPPNGNIAPPGYYLLYVLNQKGVPSEGHMIRLR